MKLHRTGVANDEKNGLLRPSAMGMLMQMAEPQVRTSVFQLLYVISLCTDFRLFHYLMNNLLLSVYAYQSAVAAKRPIPDEDHEEEDEEIMGVPGKVTKRINDITKHIKDVENESKVSYF